MLVLGIETSCDETGIALYDSEQGLLANQLFSQAEMHAEYGGVVPELASRDHVYKVLPLIEETLKLANKSKADLMGVAYTAGPGLIGAVMVGAMVGRSLAYGLGIPAVGVNHLEGHLLSPMLAEDRPTYPFLSLLVSGGHTQLIAVRGLGDYELLGETLDDAAGEAFDKVAKFLGLPYPGGPALAKLAEEGDASRFEFTRPMVDRPGLDFSFSGLKTQVMNCFREHEGESDCRADIAAGFQATVVGTLTLKCRRAIRETGLQELVVAGGVSANKLLRQSLTDAMKKEGVTVYYPPFEFCTDNGAMIAYAGCQRLMAGQQDDLALQVRARWEVS